MTWPHSEIDDMLAKADLVNKINDLTIRLASCIELLEKSCEAFHAMRAIESSAHNGKSFHSCTTEVCITMRMAISKLR